MIKYLIMDVDGTLTDGKIYMGPNGEAMKAFSVKDGYAINSQKTLEYEEKIKNGWRCGMI